MLGENMAERVLDTDLASDLKLSIQDTEKQEDTGAPDSHAAWVISTIHTADEYALKDTRARARTAFDYFNNKQWDPVIKQQMEAEKRVCITFNEIAPKIEAILGEERRNREDWIAKPREGSDVSQAEVRTALLKYVRDLNNLPYHESMSFEEGGIGGFGGLAAALAESPDGSGRIIRVEWRPWWELYWDWNVRNPDFTDAQWTALAPLVDVNRVAEVFKDWQYNILDEFNRLASDPEIPESVDIGQRIGVTKYMDSRMRPTLFSVDGGQHRIRVIEFYHRAMRDHVILNVATPQGMKRFEVVEDDPNSKALAKRLIEEKRAIPEKVRKPAIRGSIVIGRRTMTQWWSPFRGVDPLGLPYFPIFIWFASNTNNYIQGLVERMIGPQDEVNKRWSMMIENYLKQARSGGMYEKGAFEDASKAKKMWGTPGEWVEAQKDAIVAGRIKEFVAKPPDTALMELFAVAERAMDRVSNIEKARLGLTSQETSGIAIRQRAAQSALVQVKAFDNFRRMQLHLGRFLNANIKLMFPLKQIMRLTMPNGDNQIITLNDTQTMQDGAQRIINSTDPDLYDIVMDLTPSNATFRELTAQTLANLIGQIGPAIKELPQLLPLHLLMLEGLIESLDLPNRDRIVQLMRQLQQQPAVPGLPPGMPGAGGREAGPAGAPVPNVPIPPRQTPGAEVRPPAAMSQPGQPFSNQFTPVGLSIPQGGGANPVTAASLINSLAARFNALRVQQGGR